MTDLAQPLRMLITPPEGPSMQITLPAGITTLGRAPDNKVRVDSDGVSRWHAMISVDPDGRIVLKDLASSNGTHVNGLKIDTAVLRAGDMFRMGRVAAHVLWPERDAQAGPMSEAPGGRAAWTTQRPGHLRGRAVEEVTPWSADLDSLPSTLTLQLRQSALGTGGTG